MTINNETKIGLLAIIGIVLLILGFNFLKGNSLFKHETRMYAVYNDVLGLTKSNPVVINGLKVGKVSDINGGKSLKKIIVTVTFNQEVNIPKNSLAVINPNLLGSPSMEIQLGDATEFMHDGDTLVSTASSGALDEAMKVINPVLYEVKNAVKSLDSVLHVIGTVFDDNTKNNIKEIVANLNTVSKSFANSGKSLEIMMDPQNGQLAQSMKNVNSFTANLNSNNSKFDSIMENVKVTSSQFAQMDLKKTMDSLNIAINNFKQGAEKLNSNDGSLGMLLNDTKLYDNLQSTANKLNILIDDIRVHPRRYVNISVFGKKDKGNYLTAPLPSDTLNASKH